LAENTLLWEEGLLDLDNSSYGNLEVNLKRKDFHVFEDKFSPSYMALQLSMGTFYKCREWSEVRSSDSDALLPQGL
jgi:hypothetical protein